MSKSSLVDNRIRLSTSEPFEAKPGYRLIFARGAIDRLGEAAGDLNAAEVLLISDSGIQAAGHLERAEAALANRGLKTKIFHEVAESPTSEHVESAAASLGKFTPNLIVALGGGSVMDCAKGVNFVLTNGGRIEDYWGYGKASKPLLPSIGVPTTAGTGSESQSYAVVAHRQNGRKMACGDPTAQFRTVILDPDLVATAPRKVRALAAVDALAHVLESHVSLKANPISRLYSSNAWSWIDASLAASLDGPDRDTAQERLLLAAHLAGLAIENSMLGAAHACANPLTATFGISHGAAVGLMLPHVVRFNWDLAATAYQELETSSGEGLLARVDQLLGCARVPLRLREYSIERKALFELAKLATQEWTGKFNPRKLEMQDFERIYQDAY